MTPDAGIHVTVRIGSGWSGTIGHRPNTVREHITASSGAGKAIQRWDCARNRVDGKRSHHTRMGFAPTDNSTPSAGAFYEQKTPVAA